MWAAAVWAQEMVIRPWEYIWNPRRPLGRMWNHLRLVSPTKTFNLWKVLLLVFAVAMGVITYVGGDKFHVWFIAFDFTGAFWTETWRTDVSKALFIGAAVGLLAALWSDLFRNPWLCHRIRKQIKKSPECILDENLGSRPVARVPRADPIEIALREDICEEVLAGVLPRGLLLRDKKDVQVLVGEPGAGKTTALMMLAEVLAKIGILSVLVPLRSKEGQKERIKLAEKAREQFVEQVDRFVRSKDEAEKLWRWLYKRRRVAILADDIDQIGADGERGAILRQTLEDAMTLDLPVLVTARPAGLPAGMAASAISLTPLESSAALNSVVKGASKDPAFKSSHGIAAPQLEDWIREGQFTEVPFYLELLASMAATGNCPKLPEMDQLATAAEHPGRYRRMPDGRYKWNPLWVRFLLLERFYTESAAGRVRCWLGIEAGERRSSLVALEGAALGTLVAMGMKARAAQSFRAQPRMKELVTPIREEILDFLSLDDRKLGQSERRTPQVLSRRKAVSAHEAADTGERLRTLERDYQGKLQFRHRIMQAYLAGSRLAVILFERAREGKLNQEELDIKDPLPEEGQPIHEGNPQDLPWVSWLLDPHRPEKLTADMTLIFAAMCATVESEAVTRGNGTKTVAEDEEHWKDVAEHIVRRLAKSAEMSLYRDKDGDDGRVDAARITIEERSPGGTALLGMATIGEGPSRGRLGLDDPSAKINPRQVDDPDLRADPDDALTKLTAAAEAAHAIGYRLGGNQERECTDGKESAYLDDRQGRCPKLVKEILDMVEQARFGTRWTKLQAIKAIAQLGAAVPPASERADEVPSLPAWERVWEFARDRDYQVRQAAGDAICLNAYDAYHALEEQIRTLILRAAARSALGHPLHIGEQEEEGISDSATGSGAWAFALQVSSDAQPTETAILAGSLPAANEDSREQDSVSRAGISAWREDESLALEALGVVLPAIVSGLREDPEVHAQETWQGREGRDHLDGERPSRGNRHRQDMSDVDYRQYSEFVRGAYTRLQQLVALAFQGYQHPLEDALARGFKADAMRHAHERGDPDNSNTHAGPGWVASNRRMVLDVCARQAGSWYARLLLAQAIALYTIAGAKKQEAYDALTRQLHRGRERHPFTQRGTRLARAAIRRSRFPMARWHRWVWHDEIEEASRRQTRLNRPTSQLAADVTLLLDLKEGSPQDYQEPFGSMRELPHCLSASHDRQEILGKGCPDSCGWNFCPYKQAAPDEPDAQHGVSRAFCRQQQRYARHHQPKWQTHIPRRKLSAFWEQMERRART
ncbi:MAG: hypothetical protein ACTHM1_04905 [Solirubrobacteraceae bacterium]